jgi:small subunit ribosomal protein S18
MGRNGAKVRERKRTVPSSREFLRRGRPKACVFCVQEVLWIDYKDVGLLRRYVSDRGKIRSRRVTGNCAKHQRDLAVAIKNARELALMPYTVRTGIERGRSLVKALPISPEDQFQEESSEELMSELAGAVIEEALEEATEELEQEIGAIEELAQEAIEDSQDEEGFSAGSDDGETNG